MSLNVLTMGGAGGASASIFVTGLSESDTVIATKDGKTVRGKWVTKRKVLTDQPLIPTMTSNTEPSGVASVNYSYRGAAWNAFDNNSGTHVYGYGSNLPWYVQYEFESEVNLTSFYYHIGSPTGSYVTLSHEVQVSKNGTAWETIWNGSLVGDAEIQKKETISLKEAKTAKYIRWVTTSNSLNDQASEILVDFQAYGDVEIVTHGFSVSRIKSYGMWTVTATNGEKIRTRDVLVDAAIEYKIEIDLYKLWLYRLGDEFEHVTGGWTASNNGAEVYAYKRENYLEISTSSHYGMAFISTNNLVNVTGYKRIGVVYDRSQSQYVVGLRTLDRVGAAVLDHNFDTTVVTNQTAYFELQENEMDTELKFQFRCDSSAKFHALWLE